MINEAQRDTVLKFLRIVIDRIKSEATPSFSFNLINGNTPVVYPGYAIKTSEDGNYKTIIGYLKRFNLKDAIVLEDDYKSNGRIILNINDAEAAWETITRLTKEPSEPKDTPIETKRFDTTPRHDRSYDETLSSFKELLRLCGCKAGVHHTSLTEDSEQWTVTCYAINPKQADRFINFLLELNIEPDNGKRSPRSVVIYLDPTMDYPNGYSKEKPSDYYLNFFPIKSVVETESLEEKYRTPEETPVKAPEPQVELDPAAQGILLMFGTLPKASRTELAKRILTQDTLTAIENSLKERLQPEMESKIISDLTPKITEYVKTQLASSIQRSIESELSDKMLAAIHSLFQKEYVLYDTSKANATVSKDTEGRLSVTIGRIITPQALMDLILKEIKSTRS